jgi:hypothetical protein
MRNPVANAYYRAGRTDPEAKTGRGNPEHLLTGNTLHRPEESRANYRFGSRPD